MKSKQLANVLIKILGLSVCVHAVPALISVLLSAFMSLGVSRGDAPILRILLSGVGVGVEAIIGVLLIVNSPKVVELLFKGQDD
jgi:hypothetical protein